MHAHSRVVAGLPTELVDGLEASDVVVRLPIVRSGGPIDPDVIVIGAQVATTLVTFAQVPQTVEYLAAALSRWRCRSQSKAVTMEMKGPQGRVQLELKPDAQPADIAAILRLLQAPITSEAQSQ